MIAAFTLAAAFAWSNSAQAQPSTPKKTEAKSVVVSADPLSAVASPKTKPIQKPVVVPVLEASRPTVSPRLTQIQKTVQMAAPRVLGQVPPPNDTPPTAAPQIPLPQATPSPQPSPQVSPSPQPTPQPDGQTTAQPEPRVLVSEVLVVGTNDATLQSEVYRVVRTQAGRTTTRSQLQEDINAIFGTGFFSNVRATPSDTPLGVRVTFEVTPNPPLKSVQVQGGQVLPAKVVQDIFAPQYGKITNLRDLQSGIQELNKWYQDKGYALAQVVDAPQITPDGVVTLQVAEGQIESLGVRFLNKQGEAQNDKGEPIRGRTRDFIVTREFELKPGTVFNRATAERDLQRAFGLGIFEDLRLSLEPGTQDPRQVRVVVNVVERNTGNIQVGGGFSSASGLFGSVSFGQQNFGGNNQKLNAEVQLGERDQQFSLSFTDPWIAGDPFRTSYTVNLFRQRTISLVFDGGNPEINLPNGDRPRVLRTGGGLSFSRPLSGNPFARADWNASLGVQYQRVSIRDRDGNLSPADQLGNQLTFSPTGRDDLLTTQLAFVRDLRNDFFRPTTGSVLRFSTEQSIPVGSGSILFNRLRGSYSFYVPTRLTKFTAGCRDPRPGDQPDREGCPQAFAFNLQAGTVLGDLPPYEAFALGGTNSVRGYDEGAVGAGRSFLQATAEYRFPLFSIISGALFVDAATDLGTGQNVLGNPAGVRGRPGSGLGYGLGIRVQAGPLGPIRIDWGFNDRGGNNIRFGFGERF
jgi:outer membrane protein insertion porin family